MSMNTMAAIAVDRYNVIARPIKASRSLSYRKAFMMIVAVWVWSITWTIPPLFGWGAYIPEGFQTSCTFDYLTRNDYFRLVYVRAFEEYVFMPKHKCLFYVLACLKCFCVWVCEYLCVSISVCLFVSVLCDNVCVLIFVRECLCVYLCVCMLVFVCICVWVLCVIVIVFVCECGYLYVCVRARSHYVCLCVCVSTKRLHWNWRSMTT